VGSESPNLLRGGEGVGELRQRRGDGVQATDEHQRVLPEALPPLGLHPALSRSPIKILSNSKSDSIPKKNEKRESSETSNHRGGGGGGWWWEHAAILEDGVDAGAEAVPEPPVIGGGAGERHGGGVHGNGTRVNCGRGAANGYFLIRSGRSLGEEGGKWGRRALNRGRLRNGRIG